ncbi:MAG TPA: DNA gyrase subunit A [Ktedonobacterales bacterium]|jgi:DNA gyrase subunit A
MELGIVKPVGIVEQMTGAYLDYSMSVIVSRALPDVRDGLKPVHRRVLYAMEQMGLQSNKSFRKCAGIVGEVLKSYHPHGDVAVYDTLVRLAQSWNMRYPLVMGQGNFGCFAGDTKIALLDGSEKTFAELAQLPADEVFHVYSVNANGRIVVGEGRNARVTRQQAELIEVTLDTGATIRCTPDHRFMLRDGSYKEAQYLTPEDSLMPGYFEKASVRVGMNEYLQIMQPASGKYEFVHHLADAFNAARGAAKKFNGPYVRHHKNFNRFDNRPTNIERMEFLAHLHLHAEHASGLWADPQFRAAQLAGIQRYYEQNPDARQQRRERIVLQNKHPQFRRVNGARVGASLRMLYAASPILRAQIAQRMRALWQDEDYRQRMSAVLRGIEKSPLTPQQRAEVSRIVSEKSRQMWGDETKRSEIVAAIIEAMSSPVVRARVSAGVKAAWNTPAYRAKFTPEHFSLMAHILWSKPEARELHQRKIQAQRTQEEFREAQRSGVQASNQRRVAENPLMMEELTEKAAQALRLNWSNPSYQRQVMRQKIAGYVSRLIRETSDSQITPEIYDSHRNANWIPRYSKAITYFDSSEELVEAASHYNHRIISIRHLDEKADVYDITVDEHHNFLLAAGVFVHNSVDDDPPAAMRYTEAKMAAITDELLADIQKDTVDFVPNYDGHETEPTVLPARLPNLLLNGAAGIAVGMATNIPPHNLRELCDGITYLIDHPDATIEDLGKIVRGPDFPTGGIIHGREGIRNAYASGRGRIVIRARAHTEETERGKVSIIVTELPYQVNKADLIRKISELARDKKIDGISDVRDESDRQGIRVTIDLRRDARHIAVLNQLFKHTAMQTAFGANVLALVDGQPRVLTLKAILQHYITYREQVITRRTKHDLAKAEARKHILEGLDIALDHLDEVIDTIRRSHTTETAFNNLRTKFKFSEEQAKAVLDMRLARLASLERRKVAEELAEVKKNIAYLKNVLANISEVRGLIKQDLAELKEKYGDPRRTEIQEAEAGEFTEEDLIPNEEIVMTLTENGYIKRMPTNTYRAQRRGGKGKMGMITREDDALMYLMVAHSHDGLLFFTNRGRVFQLAAHELPDVGRQAKGEHLRNLIAIDQGELVTAVVNVPKFEARDYLIMATRRGEVKKTNLDEFAVVRRNGLIAMDLEDGDELVGAKRVGAKDQVMLVTTQGQAIRFEVQDLRSASRMSGGVRGIRLDEGDSVVALDAVRENAELLVVSQHGYGKRTPLSEYTTHGRGGSGVKTIRVTDKTGPIAAARIISDHDNDLMIISAGGTVIRQGVDHIFQGSRITQGVRLMNIANGDMVVAIATTNGKHKAEDDDEPEESENGVADSDGLWPDVDGAAPKKK